MTPEQIEKEIIEKSEQIYAAMLKIENPLPIVEKILREAYEDKCRAVSKAVDVGLILHTEYIEGAKSLWQIGKDESEYLKSIPLHTNH